MSKICKITLSADVFTTKQNIRKHSTVNLDHKNHIDFSANGPRNKVRNHRSCKQSCQDTSGCNFWVFVPRSEPNRRLRNSCYLLSEKFGESTNDNRVSGELNCRDNNNNNGNNGNNNGNNQDNCVTVSGGTGNLATV